MSCHGLYEYADRKATRPFSDFLLLAVLIKNALYLNCEQIPGLPVGETYDTVCDICSVSISAINPSYHYGL